ncbi:MAG: MipA/OmpV family protein [Deltaproteobacteria bacterium]|jgi:outer membrane scaffolding protein for murein synthesis (MipA/OmpV family)|nr:MipA/OmpV family protein [Deltaproteobacteria bacterium]
MLKFFSRLAHLSRRPYSLALAFLAFGITILIGEPGLLWAQQTDDLELGRRAATAEPPQGLSASQLKISLGAGLISAPEFEGGKKYEVRVLPVVELAYDRLFLSLSKGLGFRVIDDGTFTVAPSIRYWSGRDENDSHLLKGLGDVDDGLAAGAMLSYSPGDLTIFLNGYHGLGDADGLTLEAGAAVTHQFLENLHASAEISTMFADEDYNQRYFGINAKQARDSRYRVYHADSGFKHVALGGTVSYSLTKSINLGLFGEYKLLTGPAADSPLVKRGSKNQISSGLMLGFNLR